MAEFIIALFAGVGFSALFFGASFLWHERAMITREFKARIAPYGERRQAASPGLQSHTWTTGTHAEFKPFARGSDLTGFDSAELAEARPMEADPEFEEAAPEPPPVEVTTFDEGDHEFNLGEALYGTPHGEAPEDAYVQGPHVAPFPTSQPYIDADTEGPYTDTPPDPTHAIEVLDAYPAEDTAYAKALQDAMDGPRIDPAYGPLQDAIRARLAERERL